jgi:hypothetical protein
MTSERAEVALCWNPPGLESVARTVKLNVPAAPGVPDSFPSAERVTPAGGVPLARLQVYGGVPSRRESRGPGDSDRQRKSR